MGESQRETKFKIALHLSLRSVTNRRLGLKTHASMLVASAHAHVRTSARCKKVVDLSQASPMEGSTNTMISSTLKAHANAHTVCGRPTLNVFELFFERVAPWTSREINLLAT